MRCVIVSSLSSCDMILSTCNCHSKIKESHTFNAIVPIVITKLNRSLDLIFVDVDMISTDVIWRKSNLFDIVHFGTLLTPNFPGPIFLESAQKM